MWLNKIFNKNKNKKQTKTEYLKKFQLIELFSLLHKSEQLLENKIETNLEFNNFKTQLIEEIYAAECDNVADFTRIWNWFKVNNEWQKWTKIEGNELREKIFEIVDFWKRNQEFLPGTKLTLNNENGVILNENINGIYGVIRWDTKKENDEENWCGLIGSFFDSGGKILNQNFEFKYINENGTLKNACR